MGWVEVGWEMRRFLKWEMGKLLRGVVVVRGISRLAVVGFVEEMVV